MSAHHRNHGRGDAGFVAGSDMLFFGVVIMIVATLLMVELWSVLSTRTAVDRAAREASRAYVEATDHAAALSAASAAATSVLGGRGTLIEASIDEGALAAQAWGRCVRIEVVVRASVPRLTLPVLGGVGATTVTGRHSELVDPWRSSASLDGEAACDG
jgi:Flp pilus assembly protein TadG